jgi:hypothetical protein
VPPGPLPQPGKQRHKLLLAYMPCFTSWDIHELRHTYDASQCCESCTWWLTVNQSGATGPRGSYKNRSSWTRAGYIFTGQEPPSSMRDPPAPFLQHAWRGCNCAAQLRPAMMPAAASAGCQPARARRPSQRCALRRQAAHRQTAHPCLCCCHELVIQPRFTGSKLDTAVIASAIAPRTAPPATRL